jgi:hypothetical protein
MAVVNGDGSEKSTVARWLPPEWEPPPELEMDKHVDEGILKTLFADHPWATDLIEVYMRNSDVLAYHLAGGDSNKDPLIHTTAKCVACCWLAWRALQRTSIQGMQEKQSMAVLNYLDKRQDRALKQYLNSLKALCFVRSMTPIEFMKSLSLLGDDNA